MLEVLVDADNVPPARLRAVLAALPADGAGVRLVVSGRAEALRRVRWPDHAEVVPATGWQRADVVLAAAHRPTADPLLLVTGDGDFGLLAQQHAGPVLVVSDAPSGRLRDAATVVDPVQDGVAPLRQWLAAVTAMSSEVDNPRDR